jgi:DNA modification methylase
MIHPAEWFLTPAVRERLTLMEEVVWDRGSTHNHCPQLMWPTTERLYVFRLAEGKYSLVNHDGLRQRTDVWRLGRAPLGKHNAPFPVELATAAIHAWSRPGALVCDPYMGSGTTAVAAMQCGRRFEGSEILRKYYRQAIMLLGLACEAKEVA